MRLQQQTKTVKTFSELASGPVDKTLPCHHATQAVEMLLSNGFATVSSKNINVVTKVIKALREMNMEFTLRTFRSSYEKSVEDYEFTLPHFEDDRGQKEKLPLRQQGVSVDNVRVKEIQAPKWEKDMQID